MAASFALGGCETAPSRSEPAPEAPAARPAAPVRWSQVRLLAEGRDFTELEAVLSSPTRVPAAFKQAGRIAELDCVEGAVVDPTGGTPLGRLDRSDYEIAHRAAEATLGRAEAALRRAAGVGIRHARRELARGQEVAEAGVIAERDLQGLETQYDDMRAQAGEAAAAVAQARTLVEQADAALRDTELAFPFRGRVVKRMAEAGQLVAAGTPVCVVEVIDPMDVLVSLPGTLLPDLDQSVPPAVRVLDADGAERTGRFDAVAWAGDVQTGTFPVRIRLDNPDGRLRSGMRASVRLALRRGDAAPGEILYEVPLEAVVNQGDRTFVFAPTDPARRAVARVPVEVRELGRDGVARVAAAFPGPLLVVLEGQYTLLEAGADRLAVREVAPP